MARFLLLLLLLASAPRLPAQERGALMEGVLHTLVNRYYARDLRGVLPKLAEPYLEEARLAEDLDGERRIVHRFLGGLDSSHLALLSSRTYRTLEDELRRRAHATFGFELVELEQGYFVDGLLEQGPAARAGLVRGDQILAIDGEAVQHSKRLDWRSDDAALPDPPRHALFVEPIGRVTLVYRRRRDGPAASLVIQAAKDSAWNAGRRSERVIEERGYRIGYVHSWFIPFQGLARRMEQLCSHTFAECDALIWDLRGRGGSADEALRLVRLLDRERRVWAKPLILLQDADTRSAKEVIADELQRSGSAVVVGEPTRGAVIPATFEAVGPHTYLMFPSSTLGEFTQRLEGHGVLPDVPIRADLPWSGGGDPILRAGVVAARAWCDLLRQGSRRK